MKRSLLFTLFILLFTVTAFAQPAGYVPGTQVCWTFNGREHPYFKAAGNGERHILISFTGNGQFDCNTLVEAPQKLFVDSGINWDGRLVRAPGDTVIWEVLTIPNPGWNLANMITDVSYFFDHIAPIDTSEHWRFHTVGFSGGVGRQWDFMTSLPTGWGYNPYRNIFSTTINQSGAFVYGEAVRKMSEGRRHWVWHGALDSLEGTPPFASQVLYDELRGPKHLTFQAGSGHSGTTWDSCLSLAGTDTLTNRWLWMVRKDTVVTPPPGCDYGGGPSGYVPGTQVNWRFNGRDHGYFRSDVCGERHVLIVFQGDAAYDSTNYQLESPQKMLNDLGLNWNGSTNSPDTTISWEIFALPYNSGYWLPGYAADLDYYFANTVGLDTSDHSKFHVAGISGGVGRMWGYITNDQTHNSPYRSIFSTTISVAGSWFTDYAPLTAASANGRHWVWHGASDSSGTNPPIASQFLYDALSGDKRLTFQAGAGHNYVTVDSCFSLVGADSATNRWIWMVQGGTGGSLLRGGDLAYNPAVPKAIKPINLYPNPVKNKLYVDLRSLPAGAYRISITDISGRTHRTINGVKPVLYEADVSALHKGLFILQIEGAGHREQRKFIKE